MPVDSQVVCLPPVWFLNFSFASSLHHEGTCVDSPHFFYLRVAATRANVAWGGGGVEKCVCGGGGTKAAWL